MPELPLQLHVANVHEPHPPADPSSTCDPPKCDESVEEGVSAPAEDESVLFGGFSGGKIDMRGRSEDSI